MKTLTWVADNWEAIMASILVVMASIDKVALIGLKTLRNIVDAWNELFPAKDDCECVVSDGEFKE